VKLGTENRRNLIAAIALGAVAVLVAVYQFMPSSAPVASGGPGTTAAPAAHGLNLESKLLSKKMKRAKSDSGKKEKAPPSLDPMLNLTQLNATEHIQYEGSGRNIFVSQAEVEIPKPVANGTKGPGGTQAGGVAIYTPPAVTPPPPIPLKFFGFANQAGEPKKVFLSKGEDVFIAGEGEIVDRRYKVVHISNGSVEIQDVVSSGPPQTVPLTQG
jgi:hypothetical protein